MKVTAEAMNMAAKAVFGCDSPKELDTEVLWTNVEEFIEENTEYIVSIDLAILGALNPERLVGFIIGYRCLEYLLKKRDVELLEELMREDRK